MCISGYEALALNTNRGKDMNTKKNIIIIIIGIEAVIIAAVTVFLFYINSDTVKAKRQLELAQRCLSGEDYEQAVAVFEEILGIDPENEEAYLGLAEAYAETDDLQGAVSTLEEASRRSGSERILTMLEVYTEELEQREQAAQRAAEAEAAAAEAVSQPQDMAEQTPEPESETVLTGFIVQDDDWYYYDDFGNYVTGWFEKNGSRYYADSDGRLYRNGEHEIDGKKHQFDALGVCLGEVEDDAWKQAYINIIKECEVSNDCKYSLINLDNDDIPELLIVGFTFLPVESIYTYEDGKSYTIMDEWSPGNGCEDNAYIPYQNVVVATYGTAGYNKEFVWIQNDEHELVEYLSYSIWANDKGELDESSSQYFHYGKEISAEEYSTYYVPGDPVYLYEEATEDADSMIRVITGM